VFHSDRGSQYTSKRFQKLLSAYDIRSSMGHVGACCKDNVKDNGHPSLV
jgi:putative transposase